MVRTINLAMRMSNWKWLLDYLHDRYRSNRANAEASFSYAVCCLALTVYADSDLERHRYFVEVLESLQDTVNSDPEHWLARYYRAMVRLLIPPGYSEVANYIFPEGYGEGEAIEDMKVLIQKQGAQALKPPYFACPYIVMAHYYMSHGDQQTALQIFESAVEKIPPGPVQYLGSVLCQPFVQFYGQLRRAHLNGYAERLKQMMLALFPQEEAISLALKVDTR